MEAFTLIRMKEALDRIRKSSGYKVCNKVCALRERHAILYDLTTVRNREAHRPPAERRGRKLPDDRPQQDSGINLGYYEADIDSQ